tara:strand:+ start:41851 stop:42927 length:1077 start_codon:yes stop_codon:yes gene_type:complete
MSGVPHTIDDITSDWLTSVMADATGGSPVALRDIAPLEGTASFQGNLVRARIEADTGAPESIVIKMVPKNEGLRGIGRQLGIYAREAAFYLTIGAESGVRRPVCYGLEIDAETGDSAIVMEDLGALRTGDQLSGFALSEAESAIDQYALLHARWWNEPRLAASEWLPPWNLPAMVAYLPQAFQQQAWPTCAALFADSFGDDENTLGMLLGEHVAPLMNLIGTGPVTLVHGDARHDNLMFSADESIAPHMVDWQYVASGRGIVDIAYYLSQSGDPAVVAPAEQALVERYHAGLEAHGVTGYGWDDCWMDYRRLAFYALVYPIFTAALIDPAAGEQKHALGVILSRGFDAAKRLDSASLL